MRKSLLWGLLPAPAGYPQDRKLRLHLGSFIWKQEGGSERKGCGGRDGRKMEQGDLTPRPHFASQFWGRVPRAPTPHM